MGYDQIESEVTPEAEEVTVAKVEGKPEEAEADAIAGLTMVLLSGLEDDVVKSEEAAAEEVAITGLTSVEVGQELDKTSKLDLAGDDDGT